VIFVFTAENILLKFKEEDDEQDGWDDDKDDVKVQVQNTKFDQILQRASAPAKDEDDNWDDMEGADIDFAAKLQSKLVSNPADVEDDDPYQEAVENEFDEIEVEFKFTQRDMELKLQQDVASLFNLLRPNADENALVENCEKLVRWLFCFCASFFVKKKFD